MELLLITCIYCEYSANRKSDISRHVIAHHEGERIQCDQCEHSTTSAVKLNRHKLRKHETTHVCDICQYKAEIASQLKHHREIKHEGLRFKCAQSQYEDVKFINVKIVRIFSYMEIY